MASRGGREEGTSVLLTTLIGIGGIGVVAASVVIETIEDPWSSRRACPAVVLAVASVLLWPAQSRLVWSGTGRVNPRIGSERGKP
jgi:hypothetical protein